MTSPNGFDRIRRYNPRFSTEKDPFEDPETERTFYVEANVNLNKAEKPKQDSRSTKRDSSAKSVKTPQKGSSSKPEASINFNNIHREIQALKAEIEHLRIEVQHQGGQTRTGLQSLTKEVRVGQMTRSSDLEAWQKLQNHVQSMKPGLVKVKTKAPETKSTKTKKSPKLVDVATDLLERGQRDRSRETRRRKRSTKLADL